MTVSPRLLETLVFAAGVSQLLLAAASLAVPRVLDWRRALAPLDPLTRRNFLVYAGYIFGTNGAFGLVSVLMPAALCDRSPLAVAVCGFIAAYWGARLVLQFVCFHAVCPPGLRYQIVEWLMSGLFLFLTAVYAAVAFSA